MKKETYSIPITPTAFNKFQRNAVNKLKTNATAWGIPPEKMTSIDKLCATY